MEISGQLALVSGGASGMGAATVNYLAKQGAQVIVLDAASPSAHLIAETSVHYFKVDVTHAGDVANIFEEVKSRWGNVRICVNCAGIAPAKRIVGREAAMPLEDFSRVIEVNLIGTFNVMRLACEMMSQSSALNDLQERGIVINTASIAAFEGQLGQAAYSASKAGIVGLTLPAAREMAQFGVRVMTIAPGLVDTPMLHSLGAKVQSELASCIPFPKRLATPEAFAELVGHIISNSYLNGEVIRLDGALRMV